jgi:hypothetical protein
VMAISQKDRDTRRHEKAARLQEEDLRLKVRPGTKQAITEPMQWAGIEEQGEALTLMIHRLHELGPDRALPLLTPPPLHNRSLSHSVVAAFRQQSLLMIRKDGGDEIIDPDHVEMAHDGKSARLNWLGKPETA